ncbi:MAG: AmmeMemoRadiSam system protein B, partial [Deltaproteobacteria bacterium]|nr:AmmeMemoRadiSam system protein B [Deltaproteobacteria bacterium]
EQSPCPGGREGLVGGIVPHAGWYYSGKIACNVIRCLAQGSPPDTCVVFGRHLHPGSPNFIMKDGSLQTPLGDIPIDGELAAALVEQYPFTVETAGRYEQDNTIELQLPFIKYFFPETMVLPVGLPPKTDSLAVARTAARSARAMGRKCVVLGSTDLTHYGMNYGYTPKGVGEEAVKWVKQENDKRMVDLILSMDGEGVVRESLRNQNACCAGAVGAAIEAARELGAVSAEEVAYFTSYDVRPDTSFVGYVGVVFFI